LQAKDNMITATTATAITIDWNAIKATPGTFRVSLRSFPNPDFGESRPRKGPIKVRGSLLTIVQVAHAYRAGLGSGNWGEPIVERKDGGDWTPFARISYNGRIWPPEPWHSGAKALFEVAP
jgi:hypothetical protein